MPLLLYDVISLRVKENALSEPVARNEDLGCRLGSIAYLSLRSRCFGFCWLSVHLSPLSFELGVRIVVVTRELSLPRAYPLPEKEKKNKWKI